MNGRSIRLILDCRDAPPTDHDGRPCEFGLQDAHQVLHPGDVLPDGALRFTCVVAVKRRRDGSPDLGGPFVHGQGGGRFLYLGWRAIGGATWIRRYKIPLAAITWELLELDSLHAAVNAAERSATLSLLAGWAPPAP